MADHRLLLLRHAQAADYASGVTDYERPLTDFGIDQATAVGGALRARGIQIDQVLCSSATRTRQTWNALGIDSAIEYSDALYNAGSETIRDEIRSLGEEVGTALVIGHGPGLPTLAVQLAGPGSDPRLCDVLYTRYPVATLSEFGISASWADLQLGRLTSLRLAP